MMGWQWHQLDHMQIICILLQTIMPVPQHSNKNSAVKYIIEKYQNRQIEFIKNQSSK